MSACVWVVCSSAAQSQPRRVRAKQSRCEFSIKPIHHIRTFYHVAYGASWAHVAAGQRAASTTEKKTVTCSRGAHARARAHTHAHSPHTVKWHIRASHLRSTMRVCVYVCGTFVLLVSIISAHTHQCERVCVCLCAHIRHTKTLTNSSHTTVTRRCVATSRRQSCCLAAI